MAFWSGWFRRAGQATPAPRAAVQSAGGGVTINSADDLDRYLRGESVSTSGSVVTPESAMRVAAVYACVRIIAGAVATLPLHVKRRVDAKTREDASDDPLWQVLRSKPNPWQTPSQFRRMAQVHVLLRGNAYFRIVRTGTRVASLIPMHPDRVKARQLPDMSIVYDYVRPDGGRLTLGQRDVMHLLGMSLDGVTGVSPITYARETIGLALSMERFGSKAFANGARFSTVLVHPNQIGQEALDTLRASLDAFREGGDLEGKSLILEEGMDVKQMSMTAADAQWLESRKFSRSDIAMFFGVPPHMIGDTEKSTSWGSGIEQQSLGFVAYTLEDHLTMWEETIGRDLISDPQIYAKFNRAALVRGDIKTRYDAYVKALQWGLNSPDEIRAKEDENPRADGMGGRYYDPPNTAGTTATGGPDEPAQPA